MKKTEKNFHLQQLFLKIFNFSLATKFSFLIYACCFFGEGEKVGEKREVDTNKADKGETRFWVGFLRLILNKKKICKKALNCIVS